jgi:hypothetical protein
LRRKRHLEELPAAAPAPLAEVALLTLFVDLIDLPYETPHGDGWELRTYATTDGLVPLVEPEREVSERHPEEALEIRPFPVIWRPRVELPSHDDTPIELLDARDELADDEDREGGLHGGHRVGAFQGSSRRIAPLPARNALTIAEERDRRRLRSLRR